jgi:hypothetical protein
MYNKPSVKDRVRERKKEKVRGREMVIKFSPSGDSETPSNKYKDER